MAARKKDTEGKKSAEGGIAVVSNNRRATHDYEILRKVEAGIVLTGGEVKSVRAGAMNLRDSYVRIQRGEAFLLNSHIEPYRFSAAREEQETRERKLLMHRKEIETLAVDTTQKGLSVIPLRAYFLRGKCKVELGVGRGKKLHDKRQDLKRREADRAIARAMKRYG